MDVVSRDDSEEITEREFEEDTHEYIHRLYRCSSRSQAINVRTHALKYIDQWRLQQLEELDARVRTAGQLILKAFDDCQSERQRVKCSHRSKPSSASVPLSAAPINQSINPLPDPPSSTVNGLSENDHRGHSAKTEQKVEISVDRLISTSSTAKKITFNSIDFGRDCTFVTLTRLSSSMKDMAMTVCENDILVYSHRGNELVSLSLTNPKHTVVTYLEKNSFIRDLCYVEWLSRCLVITNERVCLVDYRTTHIQMIDSGIGYIGGAIDNHRCIFYLVKQSTIYKYDENSLESLQADQYPIADGYYSQRIALDHQTNDHLALLVLANDGNNYILVYATVSLADGYLYKIMIDDQIERQWICPSGNQGWLVQGSSPGSCFDININGLGSVRVFGGNEIRNMIPTNGNGRLIIRTSTDIFLLIERSYVS